MNSDAVYWIWMQCALGTAARTDDLLGVFGTARELYRSSDYDRRISGVLKEPALQRLKKTTLEDAQRVLDKCGRIGVDICTPEDADYPQALHTLSAQPLVLYTRGDLSCLRDRLSIAVVGSRSATLYSLGVTRQLSRDLARAGAVIVSGCAMGIDSAAHTGALSVPQAKTVGVLGCGHDAHYLKQNEALREEVAANGALISEYPPGTQALARNFPLRNRIISGLSRGVLVIEAGEKSGSLITAKYAAEQGRDVFAVPGDLTSLNFTGVHRLIRDGAKAVFSARDILEEYIWVYDDLRLDELSDRPLRVTAQAQPQKEKTQPAKRRPTDAKPQSVKPVPRELPDSIGSDSRRVYDLFGADPLYIDDLVRATGFEPNRVFTALTELEICGFIKMIEGKRYTLADNTDE